MTAHIETQLDIDTMKAVPTPRLDVGAKVFAAQLLVKVAIRSGE